MHRKGKFRPKIATDNQCKVKGHPLYNYTLIMVFDERIKLDENKFIIDHQEVDDTIKSLNLSGSCEEMHLTIHDAITALMKGKSIPLVAYKCLIAPGRNPAAQLYHIWTKTPRHLKELSLT